MLSGRVAAGSSCPVFESLSGNCGRELSCHAGKLPVKVSGMESYKMRNELLEAERAAAAPFMQRSLYPWWHAALLSLAGPLFALVVFQVFHAFQSGTNWAFVPSLAISLIALLVVQDQRRRRGSIPKGKAPLELRPVYRWYFVGATLLFVAIAVLSAFTSLWVSVPTSYVACLSGVVWFGVAYRQAAARTRARLA